MATIKQLQALFAKLGVAEPQRHERINAWTAGRTQSLKDLQADELQELFDTLTGELNKQKQQLEDTKRLKRSTILTIATRTGIKQPDDWGTFNHFMLHSSVVKKSLNLCNLDELELVINQFRALEYSNAKSAQKAGTKAYFNQLGMPNISKN